MSESTCAITTLKNNLRLEARKIASQERIQVLRDQIKSIEILNHPNLSVFCAGSVARGEYGLHSDLDILITFDGDIGTATKIEPIVKAELKRLNDSLGYPPLSDSGRFLTLHPIIDLVSKTGSPSDDVENRFTVRLLLLLEGVHLNSNELFNQHKKKIVENYFRDRSESKEFLPYFLLNDLLRYWRTLCLNYEEYRLERTRPWRKKSINLKFSRMLTVFATVLPLISKPIICVEDFIEITNYIPLERMAIGINSLNSVKIHNEWNIALDQYEKFLQWKESPTIQQPHLPPDDKLIIKESSDRFSEFIYLALTSDQIQPILKKSLIL